MFVQLLSYKNSHKNMITLNKNFFKSQNLAKKRYIETNVVRGKTKHLSLFP